MGDPNKRQSLDTPGSALKILVANKAAGTVIGKGGATINSIKETTGVRIKVSGSTDTFPGTQDRVVLLSGTVEAVMAASRMVIEQIVKEPDPNGTAEASAGTGEQRSLSIALPASSAGLVIGKGGDRIKAMRTETNCKIMVQSMDRMPPGSNERTVSIQGASPNIMLAVEKVRTRNPLTINRWSLTINPAIRQPGAPASVNTKPYTSDQTQYMVTMRLGVPDMSVGGLVGKGGCIVKELMQLSGAHIKVSQKGDNVPGTNNRIVTIVGAPGSVPHKPPKPLD
ncbi:hypothetical protein T484DRAFT_1628917 [Baffinella frigidus]|nr:hypothetical protein T484DRAFT_1628917 [Cryptophyta sp. CCMP2293]